MNSLEKEIVSALIDLKDNYQVTGVKAEFETEGTRLDEASKLKEIVDKAGLNLTIKIGGCGAIKELYEAKTIGALTIVAPMIETPYAMKKYVKAINTVFSKDERKNIKFLINIETITGFNNLDGIISAEEFSQLSGIVLGRADMIGSMGLTEDEINSDKIYNIAHTISEKMMVLNKDFVVGGDVCASSLPFFKNLPYLSRFETRKILFDAPNALNNQNIDKGLLKAISFELIWLQYKRELYGTIFKEDEVRFKILESRYKKLLEEFGEVCA